MGKMLILMLLSFCFQSPSAGLAQIDGSMLLSPDAFKNEDNAVTLRRNWKYHPGDRVAWADPAFDDSDWQIIADTWLEPGRPPRVDWEGIGWFRLHLTVDAMLRNRPLALHVFQRGSSEIYLDGMRLHPFGQIGSRAGEVDAYMVKEVSFKDEAEHLIAVRYSHFSTDVLYASGRDAGFVVMLFEDSKYTLTHQFDRARRAAREQMLFTGMPLAFAILHLLLFLFYPRSRENLYYAVFTGLFAAVAFMDYQRGVHPSIERIQPILSIFLGVSGLRFVYSLWYARVPKPFFLFLIGGMGLGLWIGYSYRALPFTRLFSLVAIVEILRSVLTAIWRKRDGAWIIGVGALIVGTAGIYEQLMDLGVGPTVKGIYNPTYYASIALLISMSVYLARDFAKTQTALEKRSHELHQLNVDLEDRVKQRTVELAEANQGLERRTIELTESRDQIQAAHTELQETYNALRETQHRLIQSEKMAALGKLVAGIAHEVNNPIGAINSAADILSRCISKITAILEGSEGLKDIKNNVQLQRLLKILRENSRVTATAAGRIATLVGSLRTFARLDEAEVQQADLHEGIESTLTLIQHEIRAEVEVVKKYGDIPRVHCYPGEINQVFMTLLTNAIQAIEKEGILTIETSADGSNVYVRISDTGRGIPPEQRETLFDLSFTTKESRIGVGMGLYNAYHIIQKHNGTIQVESEVGKGTMFTITLPIHQDHI